MMKASRWIGVVSLMAVLALASAAWACTGQPQVIGISPQSGPGGVEVTVKGKMISAGPVELRWNGNGISEGLKLADSFSNAAGEFSVSVRVPEVAPGVYYITIESADASVARASFEVTAEARSAGRSGIAPANGVQEVAGDLWSGLTGETRSAIDGSSASSQTRPSGIGLGMTVLAVGGMVLAGAVVTGIRHRRA